MANPWEEYQSTDAAPWEEYAAQQPQKTQGPSPYAVAPSNKVLKALYAPFVGAYRGLQDITDTAAIAATEALGIKGVREETERQRKQFDENYGGIGGATVGRVGGNIAGTLPIGGGIAKGLETVASVAPKVSAAVAPLVQSIRTGGMSTGQPLAAVTTAQGAKQVGTRIAGGAVTGGASAAAVDPDDAAAGAGFGGALGVAGRVAQGVARGPVKPEVVSARKLGYTIPPSQADSSLTARTLEGVSGKIATAQAASTKNQNVTNSLVAKALRLPSDAPITIDDLNLIRADAGKAYKALEDLPPKKGTKANSLTNTPETPDVDPKQMVYDLRVARNDADAYYKAYSRSADPEQLKKAQSAKAQATRLENDLEAYAESMGRKDLLPALREARQTIAKTYTVEKALNPTTGSVDAKVLAKELRKGKPLSGELKQVAEFADRYPKAAQTPESMGSLPGLSALDWTSGASLGTLGAIGSGSPAGLMFAAAPLARPAARKLITSNYMQNKLARAQNPNAPFLVNALRQTIPAAASPDN